MNTIATNPKLAALTGLILILPIGILLPTIFLEIESIEIVLKSVLTSDGNQPNTFGFAYMLLGMLALPVALSISVWSTLRKTGDGKRHVYAVNLVVAGIAAALMVPTWGALAEEIYRCDVLRIPNCD